MTRAVNWPEKMTRECRTVTREQMERAWKGWRPELGAFQLAGIVQAQVACKQSVANRIADAMLQRARKAGVIRRNGRAWEWAE